MYRVTHGRAVTAPLLPHDSGLSRGLVRLVSRSLPPGLPLCHPPTLGACPLGLVREPPCQLRSHVWCLCPVPVSVRRALSPLAAFRHSRLWGEHACWRPLKGHARRVVRRHRYPALLCLSLSFPSQTWKPCSPVLRLLTVPEPSGRSRRVTAATLRPATHQALLPRGDLTSRGAQPRSFKRDEGSWDLFC